MIYPFFPAGVRRIIAGGSTSYVGVIDQDTVLKYPHERDGQHGLMVEVTTLSVLGSHPRIIQLKGWDQEGLRLEYAHNGSAGRASREVSGADTNSGQV